MSLTAIFLFVTLNLSIKILHIQTSDSEGEDWGIIYTLNFFYSTFIPPTFFVILPTNLYISSNQVIIFLFKKVTKYLISWPIAESLFTLVFFFSILDPDTDLHLPRLMEFQSRLMTYPLVNRFSTCFGWNEKFGTGPIPSWSSSLMNPFWTT